MYASAIRADTFEPTMFGSDAPTRVELAVIVPTFREAVNIAVLIDRLKTVLLGIEAEIIVVDDWSDDGTAERVEELARHDRHVRLIRRFGRRGLASAVVEGMLSTVAPVLVVIDADLQHDERAIPALYEAVERGADLAIGTRYALGGSTGSWGSARRLVSRAGTLLTGMTRCPGISDPMSGFFALRREVLLEAVPRLSNLGFKVLLDVILSSSRTLQIQEIPFEFRLRTAGASKLDGAASLDFLLLLFDKALGGRVSPRLLLFLMVGAAGLGINLGVLGVLLTVGLTFASAQVSAVGASMVFNFALNNELTFRDRRLRGMRWLRGLAIFSLVCGLGAAANIGVGTMLFSHHRAWWVASIAGAIVAAVWNFFATSALAWGTAKK